MGPMPYPKTLADLLVAERMRAEMLAVRASEEAEVRMPLSFSVSHSYTHTNTHTHTH